MTGWSTGYLPAYGDWDFFGQVVTPNDQVRRTKSRAYQCCVWEGWAGTHNLFLGRYGRGILQMVVASVLVSQAAASVLRFSWWHLALMGVALVVCLAWWRIDTIRLARTGDDSPLFSGLTPKGYFFFIHRFGSRGPLWGTNRWGPAAVERFQREYPQGLQPRAVNTLEEAGARSWQVWE